MTIEWSSSVACCLFCLRLFVCCLETLYASCLHRLWRRSAIRTTNKSQSRRYPLSLALVRSVHPTKVSLDFENYERERRNNNNSGPQTGREWESEREREGNTSTPHKLLSITSRPSLLHPFPIKTISRWNGRRRRCRCCHYRNISSESNVYGPICRYDIRFSILLASLSGSPQSSICYLNDCIQTRVLLCVCMRLISVSVVRGKKQFIIIIYLQSRAGGWMWIMWLCTEQLAL